VIAAMRTAVSERGAVAYVAPMALFLAFTATEGMLPHEWYPLAYCVKAAVITCALALFHVAFVDFRPTWRVVGPSVLTGLAVFVLWIGVDKLVPYPHLGARVGFNPFEAIEAPVPRTIFVLVRLYGLALMVPVMEELFWRGFLLRYLTNSNFMSLQLEAFSWSAFWTVAVLFALAHPEWLPAVLTACVYGLLLRKTGSLFATFVAHATTNAALGAYVLTARDWVYW